MNIFKLIGRAFSHIFHFIAYLILYVILFFAMPIKVKGKKNIRKKDGKIKVYISNHLQLYGPLVMHLHFPVKKKCFWVHENMMDKEKVAEQMGYTVLDKKRFKWAPMWLRRLAIKVLKNLAVYILKYRAKGIAISRENTRELMKTFAISLKRANKRYSLVIFPEMDPIDVGVGELFSGFTSFAKYAYKKTGKIVSFYPVYIDQANKKLNICEPIDYDPQNSNYSDEIVDYITSSINSFVESTQIENKKDAEILEQDIEVANDGIENKIEK